MGVNRQKNPKVKWPYTFVQDRKVIVPLWNPEGSAIEYYAEDEAAKKKGFKPATSAEVESQEGRLPVIEYHSYAQGGKEGAPQVTMMWEPGSDRAKDRPVEVNLQEADDKYEAGYRPLNIKEKSVEFKKRAAEGEGFFEQQRLATIGTVASGVGALSLGASDVLARAFGIPGVATGEETSQALREIKEAKPWASGGGALAGTFAGAAQAPFKGAALLGEGVVASTLAKLPGPLSVIGRSGGELGIKIAAKATRVPLGVAQIVGRGIAEGGAIATGQAITDIAESKGEVGVGEAALHLGKSAVVGGATGAGLSLAGVVVGKIVKSATQQMLKKAHTLGIEKTVISSLDDEIALAQSNLDDLSSGGGGEYAVTISRQIREGMKELEAIRASPTKLATFIKEGSEAIKKGLSKEFDDLAAKPYDALTEAERLRVAELIDLAYIDAAPKLGGLAKKVWDSPSTPFIAGFLSYLRTGGSLTESTLIWLGAERGRTLLAPQILKKAKWLGETPPAQWLSKAMSRTPGSKPGVLYREGWTSDRLWGLGSVAGTTLKAAGQAGVKAAPIVAQDELTTPPWEDAPQSKEEPPKVLTPGQTSSLIREFEVTTPADLEMGMNRQLADAPPEVRDALVAKEMEKYDYLKQKMGSSMVPQKPSVFGLQTPVISSENRVKMSRYVRATVEPGTITQDFVDQELTEEAVETARTLYPERLEALAELVEGVIKDAVAEGKKYTLKEKQQINLLLGTPQTTTQPPLLLTQQFQDQQSGGQKKKTPKKPKDLDKAVMGKMQKSLSS